jgi:ribulose bisphosphate carboxylase small subunit
MNFMDDFGSTGVFAAPAAASAPAFSPPPPEPEMEDTSFEFDPAKEITPMTRQFFSDLDSNKQISEQTRMRLSQGYLAGVDQIRAQRSKLEAEQRASLLSDLQIRKLNSDLQQERIKMETLKQQGGRQAVIADQIRQVRYGDYAPEQQRQLIEQIEVDNLPAIATDPNLKTMVDTVKKQLPARQEPQLLTPAQRIAAAAATGEYIPEDADPALVGILTGYAEAEKKKMSDVEEERKNALKTQETIAIDLAKRTPKFMDEAMRIEQGVAESDTNKYLTPESQANGRIIVKLAKGEEGLKEYDTLPDEDRYAVINEARMELLVKQLQQRQTPPAEVKANSLVPVK